MSDLPEFGDLSCFRFLLRDFDDLPFVLPVAESITFSRSGEFGAENPPPFQDLALNKGGVFGFPDRSKRGFRIPGQLT